jgi:hypothetical protein
MSLMVEKSVLMPKASSFDNMPFGIDSCGLDRRICEAKPSYSSMAVGQQTACLLFLCLVTVVPTSSAQTESTSPDVTTIVARMAQARAENRARLRPYTVKRDYKLFGVERAKTKAQVIADVSFVPPNSKQYAIERANGTGLGERIVRRMLESETAVAKDYRATDFSPDNYDFHLLREEEVSGHHCYVLELLPRRKAENLLRGNIWVDATTYLLHRVDGRPAKGPSWWLREVRIVLVYSNVEGMWLQTASESTAKVRILGQHTMESRDVNYEISELFATGPSASKNLLRHVPDESFRHRIIQVHQNNLLVGNKEWIWNFERPFTLQQFNPGMPIEGKRGMF